MLDEALLWDASDSPFGLQARICLQLKGVSFRRVTLTLGGLRELRRLSPLGRVPVLVQGAQVVADAGRIARHLEAHHPEPALLPADPAARAYAALLEKWADDTLSFSIGAFKWLNPENRRAAFANSAEEFAGRALRPLMGRLLARRARRRYAAAGYGPRTLVLFRGRMREDLALLAALLADRPFLLGRVLTLADIAVFAQLDWLRRYQEGRLLDETPPLGAWLARLGEIPPIAAALAP